MLNIRKAKKEDVDLLFKWANSPDVRSNAFRSDLIPYEDHIAWFGKKVNSVDSHIFILEVDSMPAGQIRFDLEKQECFVIDYSIAKEFQNKGYGTKIIQMGISELRNENTGCGIIRAKVKTTNISSKKCFLKNNFTIISSDSSVLEFEIRI